MIKLSQDQDLERRSGKTVVKPLPALVLKVSDPLFGILREDQVGIHPILSRPRIAPDILEGMRQYILVAEGEERKIREIKVKESVADAEKDPISQKIVLRLEPAPIISKDFNKGKGIVFGYDSKEFSEVSRPPVVANEKLMAAAIRADNSLLWSHPSGREENITGLVNFSVDSAGPMLCSTEYVPGFFGTGTSGTKQNRAKARRRPYISKRSPKGVGSHSQIVSDSRKSGLMEGALEKRKGIMGNEDNQKVARRKKPKMVLIGGLSNI